MSQDKQKQRQKPKRKLLEQPPSAAGAPEENGRSKFARVLGSTDYQTRERGLQALTQWLVHKHNVTELDMAKVWKGLFYCFWHSDKAPVQEALADCLAGILLKMQPLPGALYLRSFLGTMRREWGGIDRLRLDKFMMLVRRFVGAALQNLAARRWDAGLVAQYADALASEVLLPPPGAARSPGLAYHLADVFVGALRDAPGQGRQVPAAAAAALLAPFCAALQRGADQALLDRVSAGVFAEVAAEATAPSGEGAPLALLDAAALSQRLFDLGAEEGVKARNRTACYSASKLLERAAAKRRRTGGGGGAASEGAASGAAAEEAAGARPVVAPRVCAAPAGPGAKGAPPGGAGEPAGASQPRKRKAKQAAAAAAAEAAAPGRADAAGDGGVRATPSQQPSTGKAQQQQQQQQGGQQTPGAHTPARQKRKRAPGSAADTPAARPPGSSAPLPVTSPGHATLKPTGLPSSDTKARGGGAGATPRQPAPPVTPSTAAAGGGGSAGSAGGRRKRLHASAGKEAEGDGSSKKGVRFNMHHNVYFSVGQPVPAPDIRTPPSAKPKGSALKAAAAAAARARAQGSAPPVLRSSGYDAAAAAEAGVEAAVAARAAAGAVRRKAIKPGSAPRPRAVDFF